MYLLTAYATHANSTGRHLMFIHTACIIASEGSEGNDAARYPHKSIHRRNKFQMKHIAIRSQSYAAVPPTKRSPKRDEGFASSNAGLNCLSESGTPNDNSAANFSGLSLEEDLAVERLEDTGSNGARSTCVLEKKSVTLTSTEATLGESCWSNSDVYQWPIAKPYMKHTVDPTLAISLFKRPETLDQPSTHTTANFLMNDKS